MTMPEEKMQELNHTIYQAAEELQAVWQLTREGGAYLREGTMQDLIAEANQGRRMGGRLGYLPWREDLDGQFRCYAKEVQWSEDPLSLRADEGQSPYICREDKTGKEVSRAYIGSSAKPFGELIWEQSPVSP